MRSWIMLLALAAVVVEEVCGFCASSRVQQEITEFGTIVRYCEWRGMPILPGSVLYDKESCLKVSCSEFGLKACGFGINTGTMRGPVGCRAVSDGCQVRFIRADDPTQQCQLPDK
ncbi:beta-microseminoprotein-like [Liolophura sinensis]|uniref:beta-microseminoprotein-like n=1 Tax=Liolophura sinensis TaxID=3198878 RepID=UPI0031594C93